MKWANVLFVCVCSLELILWPVINVNPSSFHHRLAEIKRLPVDRWSVPRHSGRIGVPSGCMCNWTCWALLWERPGSCTTKVLVSYCMKLFRYWLTGTSRLGGCLVRWHWKVHYCDGHMTKVYWCSGQVLNDNWEGWGQGWGVGWGEVTEGEHVPLLGCLIGACWFFF